MTAKSPFAKGKEVLKSGSRTAGIMFISLKDGDAITVAPLVGMDEMISAHMHEYWDIRPAIYHPCIGSADCPSCHAGHDARFKAYIPVVTSDGDIKILPMGIKVSEQLVDIEEEIGGDLTGHVLKIRRNGSGLKTRYVVRAIGKTVDVEDYDQPDFLPALGPTSKKEIVKLLREAGAKVIAEDEEVDGEMVGAAEPVEKKTKKAAAPKAKAAAAVEPSATPWEDDGEDLVEDSGDEWSGV